MDELAEKVHCSGVPGETDKVAGLAVTPAGKSFAVMAIDPENPL